VDRWTFPEVKQSQAHLFLFRSMSAAADDDAAAAAAAAEASDSDGMELLPLLLRASWPAGSHVDCPGSLAFVATALVAAAENSWHYLVAVCLAAVSTVRFCQVRGQGHLERALQSPVVSAFSSQPVLQECPRRGPYRDPCLQRTDWGVLLEAVPKVRGHHQETPLVQHRLCSSRRVQWSGWELRCCLWRPQLSAWFLSFAPLLEDPLASSGSHLSLPVPELPASA